MAFIPSETLSAALSQARVGLWIEPLGDGRIALVCKIPETVIKALYRGAKCSFLLSVVQVELLSVLCLGLRVEDEPDHPSTTAAPNLSPQDLPLLREILASGHTTVHCFNEMNHPALSAWASLESLAAKKAFNELTPSELNLLSLSHASLLPPSDLMRVLELALDRFQVHIYRSANDAVSDSIKMTAAIALNFDIWSPAEIFEVSPTVQAGPFRIDDEIEGQKLEKFVHLAVDSIYPGNAYWSPKVQDGSRMRELTDVLGFDTESICIIQSKGVSVLTGSTERSSERRASTVTKHVKKALNQLRGALTKIRSGIKVFDATGSSIVLPNQQTSLAHAIVVISEMYPFVDWRAIACLTAEMSESEAHRALYHVIDLQELSYLVGNSDDAASFDKLLSQRWLRVKEKGTAHGRAAILPF